MVANKKLNKLFTFVLAVFMSAMVFTAVGVANAQGTTCTGTSTLGAVFGCNGLFDSSGGINVASIIQLVFRIILYAAVLWTVWNIVLAGFKIGGAKEDADKRKEGIQAAINALIGLVVALLAFGITLTVARNVGGNIVEVTSTPCTAENTETNVNKGLRFTGFVDSANSNRCVLLDADGNVLYAGTIK